MTPDDNKIKIDQYRFEESDPDFTECFVENGFVIFKSAFSPTLINNIYHFISSRYEKVRDSLLKNNPDTRLPVVGVSRKIVTEFERDPLHYEMVHSKKFLDGMERLVGTDVAMVNQTNLWINDPIDDTSVTAKPMHQEVWSGWTPDDITIWIPYHKTNLQDTMTVVPGSHYYGIMPNRNRKLICPDGFELPAAIPMHPLEEGDCVAFFATLLHATAGRSDRIRYATSIGIRNSYAPLSHVNHGRGFIALRNGPLTRIRGVLGNDYLTPLRTYGGKLSNLETFDY